MKAVAPRFEAGVVNHRPPSSDTDEGDSRAFFKVYTIRQGSEQVSRNGRKVGKGTAREPSHVQPRRETRSPSS